LLGVQLGELGVSFEGFVKVPMSFHPAVDRTESGVRPKGDEGVLANPKFTTVHEMVSCVRIRSCGGEE